VAEQRGADGATSVDRRYHAVWITFFRECWAAGAPVESAADFQAALKISPRNPLSHDDSVKLGVNVAAMELLIRLTPQHALPLHGFAVLKESPAFAREFSEGDLSHVRELTPSGLRDDKHWPVCRSVIGQVAPPLALNLAIALVCQSRELSDLGLVAAAYKAVDAFTRKQVWLPQRLSSLWQVVVSAPGVKPKRHFSDAVLEMVRGVAEAP